MFAQGNFFDLPFNMRISYAYCDNLKEWVVGWPMDKMEN